VAVAQPRGQLSVGWWLVLQMTLSLKPQRDSSHPAVAGWKHVQEYAFSFSGCSDGYSWLFCVQGKKRGLD